VPWWGAPAWTPTSSRSFVPWPQEAPYRDLKQCRGGRASHLLRDGVILLISRCPTRV
jgi:hypothetical protein